jgi:threonine synthase
MTHEYVCVDCGNQFKPDLRYDCPDCGGILDVRVDHGSVDASLFDGCVSSMLKYESLLPVELSISLGEGGTPLTRAGALVEAEDLGIDFLLKQEGINPTNSFKDRPNAVGISQVSEMDLEKAVISSHGNAGASFAAYANRAGIEPLVLVPRGSDAGLPKVKSYHPTTVPVDGDISDTYALARDAAEAFGWYNGTTTHQVPLANTGNRTMAYELYDQLGEAPDWVLVPISAGPLLTQTYRGFQELEALGLVDDLPAMAGLQASGCAPIARAAGNGEDVVGEWDGELDTVATSIEDPLRGYAKDGTYTLRVIRESGGRAVACGDDDLTAAARDLAEAEGVLAETSSATTLAALRKLREEEVVGRGETVVGAVTGHGMNELEKLSRLATETERVSVDVEQLRQRVTEPTGAKLSK